MKRLNVLLAALGLLIGGVGAVTGMKLMQAPPPKKELSMERYIEETRPFSKMAPEEENQQPQVGNLPCNDGQMFVYTFRTRDITRNEGMFLLSSHLIFEEMSGNDLAGKLRIVILHGPKFTILVTADYIAGEIELREEWNDEDKYRMWTWKGTELTAMSYYLTLGVKTSQVTFKRGRRTGETFNTDGKCRTGQGV